MKGLIKSSVVVAAVVMAAAVPARAQDAAPADSATSTRVYRLNEVDVMPELANGSEMARLRGHNYPPELRRRRVEGNLTVGFTVRADGKPDSASIQILVRSREGFDDAARAIVRGMRFSPAKLHGEPVPVEVIIPVLFWVERRQPPEPWQPGSRPRP